MLDVYIVMFLSASEVFLGYFLLDILVQMQQQDCYIFTYLPTLIKLVTLSGRQCKFMRNLVPFFPQTS